MEPLKEMFNVDFYKHLSQKLNRAYQNFDKNGFVKRVTENLEELSLNQRMRNTSVVLKDFLPSSFETSIKILKQTIPHTKPGYTNLLFPDFVSLHGLSHVDISLEALKYFTSFGSSEFAIREFLKNDFYGTLEVMKEWSKDKNQHVRRLSSEGTRPRLPWSFKLDKVIRNPSLTKSILENLKSDPELYVRKSVANHLNDISKENAEYMLAIVKSWDQKNPHTAWIIKHASRTLIKKGDVATLSVFNYEKNPKIKLTNAKLHSPKIKLGGKLFFEFELHSQKPSNQKLVIDYVVHYRKKSGELSPKVFKLKEATLAPSAVLPLSIKQTIKDLSTRKHFSGRHVLEIQLNGKIIFKTDFHLTV